MPKVLEPVIFLCVGIFMIALYGSIIVRAARSKVMPGRGVVYPRRQRPGIYWLLMLFHGFLVFMGIFACWVALTIGL